MVEARLRVRRVQNRLFKETVHHCCGCSFRNIFFFVAGKDGNPYFIRLFLRRCAFASIKRRENTFSNLMLL